MYDCTVLTLPRTVQQCASETAVEAETRTTEWPNPPPQPLPSSCMGGCGRWEDTRLKQYRALGCVRIRYGTVQFAN